jgi:hypothetical protein
MVAPAMERRIFLGQAATEATQPADPIDGTPPASS